MKKLFFAVSVLAVLAFSLASVQANVPGARDIAPGSEFKTFFLVSKARVDTGAGPSTLLQISETKGNALIGGANSLLHFNFYTVDSDWVHNLKIPITRWQTLLKDMGVLLQDMSDVERAKLAVTFGGEDYYAGYIVVTEINSGKMDNILADVFQLDLSSGVAGAANILMKSYTSFAFPCPQVNQVLIDPAGTLGTAQYEVFSGHSMAAADNRVWEGTCANATWFALYPRYLINDDNGAKTYWVFLRSSIKGVAEVAFHTWVINKAEDYRSTTIKIREMSVLDAGSIIPDVLKLSLPYIGQLNLKIPGEYDPGTVGPVPSSMYLSMELVGWNWKAAQSPDGAALNWRGMTVMAADAGTTGEGYHPNY